MCLVLHSGKEKGWFYVFGGTCGKEKGLVLCVWWYMWQRERAGSMCLVLHSGKEKGLVLCVWCYIVAKRKGWFYVFGVT